MNIHADERARSEELFSQREEQLKDLPSQILLQLARNESSPHRWRKAAVQIMLDHKYPEANHPDLLSFVVELRSDQKAKDEVIDIVETASEQEFPPAPEDPKPPKSRKSAPAAGFTTENL